MTISRKLFGQLAEVILEGGAKKATKYLARNLVVKATYRGKRDARYRGHTILFTIGKPNYAERKFITQCNRVNERFPVSKIQLRWPTKR